MVLTSIYNSVPTDGSILGEGGAQSHRNIISPTEACLGHMQGYHNAMEMANSMLLCLRSNSAVLQRAGGLDAQ